MLIHRLATLTGLAVVTLFLAAPANALTMAECSTKYNAAKDAGTLAGQTWNQFRKAQCGTDAAATTDTKPADTKKAAETKPAKAAKAAAADAGAAKGLTAKECSAKYQAAKAAGTLNGMKWNDFRKTECAAGASAAADTTKPATTKAAAAPAEGKGLTMAECSTKYQAAKTANTLKGQKWNDFRKAECGAAASEDDSVPAPSEANYTKEPAKPTTAAPKGVTFPSAISPKYASETPGKGRMHTCLDQYYVLKDANALGGLKWIQKGGGFYSLCNAKLKG
ncbi:hypothetical protein EFV37_06660 [Mesorhizobium loti]|uniref:Uncharacterized protein n=1 Tax=Mesorhizobium jarvisii TaxID=1777867 RepID=A0A6M7TAF8_9HYPH|nr:MULTISPECIES: hypothetical protein [Mesorhizobium]OBQ76615.1 hypothetical protein A9K72_06275 [Mesorhizobium loti]QKC62014.1 hypothetical protein EB229_06655 [Mesorhizobium jarvisii]QKD07925.1 hypothetical protein EFV37_06660 [Mesorhizobium loti]RJT35704.1 hypothetical protein D3242_09635 [Mesorhizobium jarvisii]BCG99383.1 hypothetical protein MesoLj131b_13830 [Mesorhizobium sp. 131-2-5]